MTDRDLLYAVSDEVAKPEHAVVVVVKRKDVRAVLDVIADHVCNAGVDWSKKYTSNGGERLQFPNRSTVLLTSAQGLRGRSADLVVLWNSGSRREAEPVVLARGGRVLP